MIPLALFGSLVAGLLLLLPHASPCHDHAAPATVSHLPPSQGKLSQFSIATCYWGVSTWTWLCGYVVLLCIY
jgi:hypothetical protein